MMMRFSIIIFAVCIASCLSPVFAGESEGFDQNFLLIYDSWHENSLKTAENIRKTFKFSLLSFEEFDVRSNITEMKLRSVFPSALILALEDISLVQSCVDSYLAGGGTVVAAMGIADAELLNKWGLSDGSSSQVSCTTAKGLVSCEQVYQNYSALLSEAVLLSRCIILKPSSSWKVILKAKTPVDFPILLHRSNREEEITYRAADRMNGNIILWNSDCIVQKRFRGLFLFSLFSSLKHPAALPTMNSMSISFEDSPPPTYAFSLIKDNGLSLDCEKYYEKDWYPKIIGVLREMAIKTTHAVCVHYSNCTQPPFSANNSRSLFLEKILNILLLNGHEVAFHGYNHHSLTVYPASYTPWPTLPWLSKSDMVESLQCAKSEWNRLNLRHPTVYFPPNNLIDKSGIAALSKVFPTIRAICANYYQPQSIQNLDEFSIDESGKFLSMPRISEGATATETQLFDILNGIMCHGIINHCYFPFEHEKSDPFEIKNHIYLLKKLMPVARNLPLNRLAIELSQFFRNNYQITGTITKKSNFLAIKSKYPRTNYFFLFPNIGSGRNGPGSIESQKSIKIENGKIIAEVLKNTVYLIESASDTTSITLCTE
ncbi:MAG: DUF2194 domain-containing protein [Candidatus Riflebacteria bacterium]|nr:DUF2194 domain-containing protein [Candidatus Riflebacteria bacterium]